METYYEVETPRKIRKFRLVPAGFSRLTSKPFAATLREVDGPAVFTLSPEESSLDKVLMEFPGRCIQIVEEQDRKDY